MNIENWNKLLDDIQNRIKELSGSKGTEYTRGIDRFYNFKRASEFRHFTPERCLEAMMSKHVISIYDQLDDLDKGIDHPLELWEQKIFDNILYLCLLYGLLKERYENCKYKKIDLNNYIQDGYEIHIGDKKFNDYYRKVSNDCIDVEPDKQTIIYTSSTHTYTNPYDINYYLDKENINKHWIFFYRKGCNLCNSLIKDFEINGIIFKKYDINTVDGVRMLELYEIKNSTILPIIIESEFTKNLI